MQTIQGSPNGASQTWINDSGQPIYDSLLMGKDDSGDEVDPSTFGITVQVNGETQPWNTTNGFNGTNWKKKVTDKTRESCGQGEEITVETPDALGSIDLWFTNKQGCPIGSEVPVLSPLSTNVTVLPGGDPVLGSAWSACLRNQTDYLILGFTFSESSGPLTMVLLHSSCLGSTSTADEKVSFEYPLQPRGGWAVISARYSATPTADTTVSCTPIVSKVIPESVDPRRSFAAGTGISMPDITLQEVEAGSIKIQGTDDEIVLQPREQFAFAGVSGVTVLSGNLQLGTPSITNGEIHIPILAASSGTGKSKVKVSGITINTLTGLREGTVSVHQEEPSGNSSNFPFAYFDPQE